MKYDCNLTFSIKKFMKCYKNWFLNENNYDELGWAYREKEEVFIWKGNRSKYIKIFNNN